ncbi:sugar glycosyltransferase [Raoultella sp. WB_B2P2-3]|uniref:Sugar glycosyltransferase n=1 Tax=Raoultella scottii TaxID=3040937 RepID=A0ABU8Z7Q9_9ENTR|nr:MULTISPECIES: sugar glycosyltransferase [Enterobacteriaceae]MVT04735.1 sugar glycosyltransferase [Raoultella sp. 10-1]PAC09681.1 sugar glycosyltransferase [Enterobacter sp. 10-1]
MGSLFKQIYRYTHPRAFRHNENLWPWAKITRAASGEICSLIYKGKTVPLCSLSELKNSFSGPLLLTATGPSVKDIDFSVTPRTVPVMGVNGAFSLEGKLSFSLYLIVDMEFFDRKPDIISAIVSNPQILFFTTAHGIAKIIDRTGMENIRCRLALIEDACYKIYQPRVVSKDIRARFTDFDTVILHERIDNIAFSIDIRQGIFDAGTVAYWALQIIAYLGFDKVIIAGLDMNNFNRPRFYENDANKLPSYLESKVTALIFPALALASRYMQSSGINIINTSINSAVPVDIFSKVPFSQIVKEVTEQATSFT